MNTRPESCLRRIFILCTWAKGQAHLGKVRGGVKREQIFQTGITVARNKQNRKTKEKANCVFARLKTTMIAETGRRSEGN